QTPRRSMTPAPASGKWSSELFSLSCQSPFKCNELGIRSAEHSRLTRADVEFPIHHPSPPGNCGTVPRSSEANRPRAYGQRLVLISKAIASKGGGKALLTSNRPRESSP